LNYWFPQGFLRHIGRNNVAVHTRREIASTAEAIQRYLATRPNASETVDGVAKWWLLRQRYEDSIEHVQLALNLLEERGLVIKIRMNDGKEIYKSAREEMTRRKTAG
jgi:Fe2+ or Zn2+ uptake regulation protein